MARRTFAILLVVSAIGTAYPSNPHCADIPLALDDAVRMSIERNLALRVEIFNPAIARTDVRRARAIYNTRLAALLDHRGEDVPVAPDSSFALENRFFDANISADRLLSSGGTASASFTNLWSRVNQESRIAEPKLSLSLTQPVLKGFGKEVTEKDITVALGTRESVLLQWRTNAIATAATARDLYFSLIKAHENLATRKAAIATAREIHAGNQARVKAGVLAAVELLDSELGVAQREKDLLLAENNARDAADKLRVFIQYRSDGELVPGETIPPVPTSTNREGAIETALGKRPDLLAARISLRTQEFTSRVARNGILPSVNLTGSVGVEAMGTGYGSALDDLKSGHFPFWSVGISFAYPIGNDAAEADLASNRLRARQAETQLRNLEENVRLDVRTAIRNLETNIRQVEVAVKGVALADARLASYIKRGKVGLAVTKDVLQAESDLTTAREGLAAARADSQSAVTQLWKSTGELLERQGIAISDDEIDTTARKDLP